MAKNGRSEMEGAWTLMIRGGQNSPERPTWELPVCEDRNYASPVSFVLFCFFWTSTVQLDPNSINR